VKKDVLLRLAFLISLLILTSVVKKWLSLAYWPYWLGGLIGLVLPSLDHIVYVFFQRPYELTPQRVRALWEQKNYRGAILLLYQTRSERTNLIFHSLLFQAIFVILTFWVVSSSGSPIGRGVVLSFYLNLLLDEITNPIRRESNTYLIIAGVLLVIFSFLF
jgi:hypothetical protein